MAGHSSKELSLTPVIVIVLALQDKDRRELDNLDSAAELRRHAERAREKEDEAMAPHPPRSAAPVHVPPTRFSPPSEMSVGAPPPVMAKQAPRVGESFV